MYICSGREAHCIYTNNNGKLRVRMRSWRQGAEGIATRHHRCSTFSTVIPSLGSARSSSPGDGSIPEWVLCASRDYPSEGSTGSH